MDQNMRTEGGKFLNGTRAEEHVAFYNQKNVSPSSTDLRKRRRGVMDSRFKMATAQFVAAGSYGVLHATLMAVMSAAVAPGSAVDQSTSALDARFA